MHSVKQWNFTPHVERAMAFGDPEPYFSPLDQELMMGASYGSDVTVEELVITAPDGGGGAEIWVYWDDYQEINGGEYPDFTSWAEGFEQQANDFATQHITGDPNSSVYQQAKNALAVLYSAVKLNPGIGNMSIDAPNGHTLTLNELLSSLEDITIHIGPHSEPTLNAYTQWNLTGTHADIYIDPDKMTPYLNAFGGAMGTDYVIYHELGHAVADGWTDHSLSNAEQIANEYGQVLAEQAGVAYPIDQQLPGGTVPR